MSSASADVALEAGADEPAEALCEGGSCNGNHGFTRGAPSVFWNQDRVHVEIQYLLIQYFTNQTVA
ncbi:MAG: hypothetical protein JW896_11815 [Deltaproteobacteria bacterium]|nr:hypothetical protein [Deltaproteobacteria bacterium]